jgi:hypothetical protein
LHCIRSTVRTHCALWSYLGSELTAPGPVVRVAPNELSFASPNAARDIFAVGKGFTKTEFYKVASRSLVATILFADLPQVFPPAHNPDIFTETREWKHAQMKRAAVTPYSLASMQKRAHLIEDVQKQLVETIDRYLSPAGKVCDLGNLLHYFAFDVSLECTDRPPQTKTDWPQRSLVKLHSHNDTAFLPRRRTLVRPSRSSTICNGTTVWLDKSRSSAICS